MTISAAAKGAPVVLAGLLLAYGPAATAQNGPTGESARSDLSASTTADLFLRDRSVSVRDRPHPEYDSGPHRVGAFNVTPTVEVTGEYNDNIYALDTDKVSDSIAHVHPSVYVDSNWARHYVSILATGTLNRYASHTLENTNDWQLRTSDRIDLVRGSSVTLGADAGRFTEPRTSSSTQSLSVKPIRFRQYDAFVAGVREVNRIRLSVRGDWRKFDYQDGIDASGLPVFEQDRDHSVGSLLVRGDYALSPETAVFLQVSGNRRDYRLEPPAVPVGRDSNGAEILGGLNFELTNLIRGELSAGYLDQHYKDVRFNTLHGLGMRGQVEWFPTPLTTVTLFTIRSIEDSGIPGTSGYLSTIFSVEFDHELLRNLILTAVGSRASDEYFGIDRTDRRLDLNASATYLMNRRIGWTIGYSHLNQHSRGLTPGPTYGVNRVTLELTAHL